MTTFHDALSGEKRKLNLRTRTPTPEVTQPYCERTGWGHIWKDWDCDDSKCINCGQTVLFVRAQRNLKKAR